MKLTNDIKISYLWKILRFDAKIKGIQLIEYEDTSYASFYFDTISEIITMENILVFEKEFIKGNGDLESFKRLIDLTSYSVLRHSVAQRTALLSFIVDF